MNSLASLISSTASQASELNNSISSNAQMVFHSNEQIDRIIGEISSFTSDFPENNELKSKYLIASSIYDETNLISSQVTDKNSLAADGLLQTKMVGRAANIIQSKTDESNLSANSYRALASSYEAELNMDVARVYDSLANSAFNDAGQVTYNDSLTNLLSVAEGINSDLDGFNSAIVSESASANSLLAELNSIHEDVTTLATKLSSDRKVKIAAINTSTHASEFINSINQTAAKINSESKTASLIISGMRDHIRINKSQLGIIKATLDQIQVINDQIHRFAFISNDDLSADISKQVRSHSVQAHSVYADIVSLSSTNDDLGQSAYSLSSDNYNVSQVTSLAVDNADAFGSEITVAFSSADYAGINSMAQRFARAASISDSGASKIGSNVDRIRSLSTDFDVNDEDISDGSDYISSVKAAVVELGSQLASANAADNLVQLSDLVARVAGSNQKLPHTSGQIPFEQRYHDENDNYDSDYQTGSLQARDDQNVDSNLENHSDGFIKGYIKVFNNKIITHPNHAYSRKTIYQYGQMNRKSNRSRITFFDVRLKKLGLYRDHVLYYYTRKLNFNSLNSFKWTEITYKNSFTVGY
ncbi:hypothetical protein [Lactobacillus sp. Sy-1]|uniref:hypothetical protein n=1 Tax=Lactobacillus sp. Sy-1 TaxID=2109645 RepID=UPI001C56CFD1|nr:hypothetical protein [Lactobacillus sp. Sy-1]MBW1605659.1 hypothetical protein [Lactobacillus sp. Sy-1]